MKRYGRIQGLVLSLGSPAFYYDVARRWGGIGLLYLLLLFTLTWIPLLVKHHFAVSTAINEEFPKVIKDWPTITIQGGRVSSQVAQPFTIRDPNTGETIFVLDTTGKINSLDQTDAKILLTETKLFQRDQHRVQVHDLAQFPDMTISQEWLRDWAEFGGRWLMTAAFPFVMIGSLIRALILMLLAALFGLIFNASFGAGLGFGALLRMAAVGLTLSVYLDTIFALADISVPFWFLIALALTTVYVAYGTWAAGPPPDPLPPPDYDPWDISRPSTGYKA